MNPSNSLARAPLGLLGAVLLLLVALTACSGGAPPSSSPTNPGEPTARATSTAPPSETPSPVVETDLTAIVIPRASPPRGMTFSGEEAGRQVLDRLPLFPVTAAQLKDQSGFVDGRSTNFAGSTGFILTWVVQYASLDEAMGAFSILLNELQSEDHYGWGVGVNAGLGDEGTCLEGDNPQLDGLHETICVWRHGSLVMIVGGGSDNEIPIDTQAAAMDARADIFYP